MKVLLADDDAERARELARALAADPSLDVSSRGARRVAARRCRPGPARRRARGHGAAGSRRARWVAPGVRERASAGRAVRGRGRPRLHGGGHRGRGLLLQRRRRCSSGRAAAAARRGRLVPDDIARPPKAFARPSCGWRSDRSSSGPRRRSSMTGASPSRRPITGSRARRCSEGNGSWRSRHGCCASGRNEA